jgi:hypothetical protein
MRPRYSTSTRRRRALAQSDGEPPSWRASGRNGPRHLEVLGRRPAGHVDRGEDRAAGERRDDLLGGLEARAVGGLGRRCAEVRVDDHVRRPKSGVLGDGLGAEHVERRAADLARVERLLERVVVDQRAARDVEDPHTVAHLRERTAFEPVLRLGRLWQMQRDESQACA